ncbi:S49 family peptidase [Agrobacterium rhizogenes]|uniref:S49 family peptidase n=1 Tax=Rhizobium rhizogenes TaxID=359 RepID=UPI001573BA3B|nr:S49 family peptidase [Rhizobium rhizogenes]NTF87504.1 S49 family peptidase [Rhizobium rhizogenes]
MSFAFAQLSQRLFDTPLMYDERKAETFVRALGPRIAGTDIIVANGNGGIDHVAFANGRPSAGKVGDQLGRAYERRGFALFDTFENAAIIPVEGSLIHKGAWVGASSGETSYQGLQTQITAVRQAYAAKKIKGAIFEVDSFGGEVNGAFETAAAMQAMSREMPTLAILTDFAYSAGYLLASQARQIIMPEFGGAGSIGVIILHADYSAALEQDGIKVTIIRSGKMKAEGNPYEALPARVAERWQAQADTMRDKFAETVAKGRGKRITKAKALSTEADAFDANESLSLGLVDVIADPLEAFAAFLKEINRS